MKMGTTKKPMKKKGDKPYKTSPMKGSETPRRGNTSSGVGFKLN